MRRRTFIQKTVLASAGLGALNLQCESSPSQKPKTKGFFTTKKIDGRWWLLTPDKQPFWSIGMNHVDPATLRYSDSNAVWEQQYDNSMESWLAATKADLTSWGFNTLGWNQEVVTINDEHHRHSRSFTFEEYQWLDMPYCHLLPFIESHQWEIETRLPDIRSAGFAEWCDYVARDQCARMKDDPKLIGYFFTDCPTWIHESDLTAWKAPLFDPAMLESPAGKKELFDLATTYYRVITESIRRYDPNHLILGDRYEANRPLPEEVVNAALPYIDVLSFQCFGNADWVGEKLGRWAKHADKPLLLADNAQWLQPFEQGWPPKQDRHIDPVEYLRILHTLRDMPHAVGYHLCGAYLRNKARKYGLKDHRDQPDGSAAGIQQANEGMLRWLDEQQPT